MRTSVLISSDRRLRAAPLASHVVHQLGQLHVAVRDTEPVIGVLRCAYDGHPWPCKERLLLDGRVRRL